MANKQSIPKNNVSDFEEQIKRYGEQIETLDDVVTKIRTRLGMFIGAKGNQGYLTCIKEIVNNAFDELIKKDSPCNYVFVQFDERDQSLIVLDNGRGIPIGSIVKVYNGDSTSSNYSKQPYQYSAGVNGVGAAAACVSSSEFVVNTFVLGNAREMRFIEGYPAYKQEKKIPCPNGRQGTTVYMKPSIEALGPITLTCNEVFNLVFSMFPLTNIGDKIDFIGVNKNGKTVIEENLTNKDGILSIIMQKTQTPLVAPIGYLSDNGTMFAECIFTWDMSAITSSEDVTSYSNFVPTLGGTHVDGFIDGICSFFRNYMNKIFLGEKSKITVVNSDIKSGLRAVVNAKMLDPVFVGQSKSVLRNEEAAPYFKALTYKCLDDWSKVNNADLNKLCKYFKEIAEIRSKEDDSKIKLSTKYETNLMTGKPKKYVQPSGNKELELIIVEGNSAMGSAKNSRDHKTQALYPIRGKLPNAFTTSKATFLANEEIASIITIIGGGYGKNFDITKVKFDKIIIMSDADYDGYHIRSLFLRFILLYMPELIQAGKVYGAVPPLYGVKAGKGMKYFTNKIDFTRYIQGLFNKQYNMCNLNGYKLTNNQITDFFIRNIDYNYYMNIISSTFAVDMGLLEDIMYNYGYYVISNYTMKETKYNDIMSNFLNGVTEKTDFETVTEPVLKSYEFGIQEEFSYNQFKKYIEKKYRFMKVSNKKGVISLEGLVNGKYQYVYLNDKFINACKELIYIVGKNNALYYKVNGETCSISTIMNLFDKVTPSGLTRYKGLGEQNPSQLGESVLRPDSSRTLIRYNIEDVKQEIDLVRYIDSNRSMLVKDVTISRRDIE